MLPTPESSSLSRTSTPDSVCFTITYQLVYLHLIQDIYKIVKELKIDFMNKLSDMQKTIDDMKKDIKRKGRRVRHI